MDASLYNCSSPLALVTVYIVNHNYGRFLRQAAESVLEQTYQNIEILLVDDASDDESSEVIRFLEREARILVVQHSKPRGLTACCNSAIHASKGEFLMRLDADDYLTPRAVEYMMEALLEEPAAVLASCDYVEIGIRGKQTRRLRLGRVNHSGNLIDIAPHGACVMVRRTFLDKIGGYDETIPYQDGLDLWLNLSPQDQALSLHEPLFYYRQHGSNLSRNTSAILKARTQILAKHVARRELPRPKVLGLILDLTDEAVGMPLWCLGGRPLIEWIIDEASQCQGLDRLVVSSYSKRTIEHLTDRYGAAIGCHVTRDGSWTGALNMELATGNTYDAVMILNVESPFQSSDLMQQSIDVMQLYGAHAVLGVQRDEEVFYRHNGYGLEPIRLDDCVHRECDDLYRVCSGLRLLNVGSLVGDRFEMVQKDGRVGHVLVDQASFFTIHTDADWELAQQLALTLLKERGDGS